MNSEATLNLLLHGNQLKRTVRSGWVQRGIPNPESVAAHSYGVAFAVLTLAPLLDQPINMERALTMVILHDLPEGLTTDIPVPSWRYLPANSKSAVERRAMRDIFAETPQLAPPLLDAWEELNAGQTIEAKLTHDADKLDLFIQAYQYERQFGARTLEEFWLRGASFHFEASHALFETLVNKRKNEQHEQ